MVTKFIQKFLFCFFLISSINVVESTSSFQARPLTDIEFIEMVHRLPVTSFQKMIARYFLEGSYYEWANGVHLHTIQNNSGWYDGENYSDYVEFAWIYGAWQVYGTFDKGYDKYLGNGEKVWLAPMTLEEMAMFPLISDYEFTHWIIVDNGSIAFPAYHREYDYQSALR